MKKKKNIELDHIRLKVELAKREKNLTWLADQMGVSRQYIWAEVKRRSITRVPDFARILRIRQRDLYQAKL